jgi:hypothetical protein
MSALTRLRGLVTEYVEMGDTRPVVLTVGDLRALDAALRRLSDRQSDAQYALGVRDGLRAWHGEWTPEKVRELEERVARMRDAVIEDRKAERAGGGQS